MGSFSVWHWLIVAVVVLLLFGGRGKLSSIMGDAAKGIKAFQRGLKDEDTPRDPEGNPTEPASRIEQRQKDEAR